MKINPLASIVTIGSSLGALAISFAFWSDYGWKIRKDYDREHLDVPQTTELLQAIQEVSTAQKESHNHWICDETYEELPALRHEVNQNPMNLEAQQELAVAEETWDELDCIQYFIKRH